MSKFTLYQVLVRHFGNSTRNRIYNGSIAENGCGKMNDFTTKALSEIKEMGISHIWYTGLLEHATQTNYEQYGIRADHPKIVKGKAGSPYAVKDYYDIDPDLAVDVDKRMKEFENLVTRTHKADLKLIIDFIPNHVARSYYSDAKPEGILDLGETDHSEWAFSPLNNFYYCTDKALEPQFDCGDYHEFPAKATGNDQFTPHPSINDWYETIKLNYGVHYLEGAQKQFDPIPNTWFKMYDILHFWATKKVDGFRCDMAEMVPVEFWGWVIPLLKTDFPEIIFIAEVYNPAEYRHYIFNGKFDYLYDKVGLYDKLRDILTNGHAASDLTQCWQALSDIQDHMLTFLENHDEQRIASDFFCGDPFRAFPAMIAAATLSKAPVMIYSGQEFGEKGMDSEGYSGCDGRTSIFDYWNVCSVQKWVNGGKFGDSKLSKEQVVIQQFYKNLLNLSLNEKAIRCGKFFDLEYANFNNPSFDTRSMFAYMRAYKEEVLLIVLNFGNKEAAIAVNIPFDAFKYLQLIEHTEYQLEWLLDSEADTRIEIIESTKPIALSLQPYSGQLIKLIEV